MTKNKKAEAALQLLESGFSVIPVSAENKKALVKWRQYQIRKANRDTIIEWFTKRFPDASVAVLTGKISNVVVVDCDAKKMAKKAMDEFLSKHPTEWVVNTGGGGRHYYYRYPDGVLQVKNRATTDWVDIRGDGGYVVVPPSVHKSGKAYVWRGGRGNLESSKLHPYSDVWIGKTPDTGSEEFTSGPMDTEHWLSEVMEGVDEGGRNDTTARLAGYYFGKGMAYDVVLTLMNQWNERNRPPAPWQELLRTVKSVWEKHTQNNSRKESASSSKKSAPLMAGQDPFAILPLAEYMVQHGSTAVSWTVEDWLPDKTIAMVVAPPGTYKTWMTFDMGLSIATGTPFLKRYKVINPGPVVIVQQEDFHGQIAERLATILRDRQDFGVLHSDSRTHTFRLPADIPLYLHPDRRLRFHDDVVMDALERTVSDLKPRLVIIDPLYSTGETDDYMAKTVQAMFRLKDLRDRYGCSFLLAHHTKKSAEGTTREGLWGSQFLNAFLETGWQLRRQDNEGEIVVRRHFKVSQNSPEEIITFDIQTTDPVRYSPQVREPKTQDVAKPGVLDVLTQVGPMKEADLVTKTGRTPGEVKRVLKNLSIVGAVEMDLVTKRWEAVLKGDSL